MKVVDADMDSVVRAIYEDNRPFCMTSDGLPVLDDVSQLIRLPRAYLYKYKDMMKR